MGKKSKQKEDSKARIAERNAKIQAKSDKKEKKQAKKVAGSDDEEDIDADEMLAIYAKKQAAFEKVEIKVLDEHPSRRLNSTMVTSPLQGKSELFLFGGETTKKEKVKSLDTFSGTPKTYTREVSVFYNDLYHYTVDKDQWRLITSPNAPLPRAGHSMCAHPSGIILLFGGEFSSPLENTFYHYGDTWVLDAESKEWTKIDLKPAPSARSGHRMAVWKNYILLHGGFKDLGTKSLYQDDLWAFDITTYKWSQIEFPSTHIRPDARSGHSLLPHAEGGVIWGGYSKVSGPKGLQKGKVHSDYWLLKMKPDLTGVKWERRKRGLYQPSTRVGCSMTYHKGRGILFGGVYDTEKSEMDVVSTFYNDLYTYQVEMNKWFALKLRAPRKRVQGQAQNQNRIERRENRDADLEATLSEILNGKLALDDEASSPTKDTTEKDESEEDEDKDEVKKEYVIMNELPHPRYNAAITVVDDTLFIFCGGYEYKEKEYHLDSMYSIDLGKLDGCKVLWEDISELVEKDSDDEDEEWEDDNSDEDMDSDYDDDEDDEDSDAMDEDEEETKEDEVPDPDPGYPNLSLLKAYASSILELLMNLLNGPCPKIAMLVVKTLSVLPLI